MTDDTHAIWRFFNPLSKQKATYHFDTGEEEAVALIDAINVALAIGRPLLVTGDAGTGKSSIARGVAETMDWRLMPRVTVTSRSEPEALKAEFDDIQRLSDAGARETKDLAIGEYMRPGALWQLFNPQDALHHWNRQRGGAAYKALADVDVNTPRVMLIDEIDKGDIDFANDLLDVFDDGNFKVPRTGHSVTRDGTRVLLVITSNQTKTFSDAFTRRCIPVQLKAVLRPRALKIAAAHSAHVASVDMSLSALTVEQTEKVLDAVPVLAGGGGYSPAMVSDMVQAAMEFLAQGGGTLDGVLTSLKTFFHRRQAVANMTGGF